MAEQYSFSKKYHNLSVLESETVHQVSKSEEEWAKYLTTAARLYRYPFEDQMLIYAQRPEATACAELEDWNERMFCWVNRGAKGIALFDRNSERPKLRYVYDVSDVHKAKRIGKDPYLWKIREEHKEVVLAQLEKTYGETVSTNSFESRLMEIAKRIAGDYYGELMQDMSYAKEGSFLEELDELNVGLRLRETLSASIAYTLLSRCGADTDVWRDELNFNFISEFNTTMALSVVGNATTDLCKPLLVEIERTVAAYDRQMARQKAADKARESLDGVQIDSTEKKPEKVLANAPETRYNALKRESDTKIQTETATNQIEKEGMAYGTDIREERGLSDTQPDAGQRAGGSIDQVRADAQGLSGEAPEGDLQRASDGGQAESALSGETEAGGGTDGRADGADGGSGRRDGGTESVRSDEMGAADEQHQTLSRGNRADGVSLQPVSEETQQNRETEKPDNGEDSLSGSFLDNMDFAQKAMEIQKGVLCSDDFLNHKRPEIAGYFQMEQDVSLQTEYFKNCFRFGTYYGLKVADTSIGFSANDKGIHINMTGKPGVENTTTLSWEDARYWVNAYMEDGVYLLPGEKAEQIDTNGMYKQLDLFSLFTEQVDSIAMKEAEQAQKELEKAQAKMERDTKVSCKNAIERTVAEKFDGRRLPKDTAEEVIKEYGIDRVSYVLANSVAHKRQDTRLSDENKEWAKEIEPYAMWENRDMIVDSHPAVLNGFINQTRRYIEREKELAEQAQKEIIYIDRRECIKTDEWKSGADKYVLGNSVEDSDFFYAEVNGDTHFEYDYKPDREKIEGDYADLEAMRDIDRREARDFPRSEADDDFAGIDAAAVRETLENGEAGGQETSGQDVQRPETEPDYKAEEKENTLPEPPVTTESTIYPGDKNGLPYDIVIEKLHFEEPERTEPEKAAGIDKTNAANFRITEDSPGAGAAGFSPKEKFKRNIEAIRTLEKIEGENRIATPEEQKILAQYVGWGGLADAFDEGKSAWAGEYQELKSLLSEAEYASARESTLNAHYTSPAIIRSIYEALENMGFEKGNVLEPAMGIGNFFGMLPEKMQESRLYGVELDGITGRIARQLYPKADIKISGFEKTDYPNDFFDVAVGNVPFGQYKVSDRQYDKNNFLIHDYFFAKALDKVRPGGVVAFVTSKGTMDKKSPEVRKYLAQRAELLGAVRLPNTAFKENAGTEVTSDILFLKKRDRVMDLEPDWVHLSEDGNGIAMNDYFVQHPEMIVGKMEMVSGPYGMESTCKPDTTRPFMEQLREAVSRIDGEIEEAEIDELDGELASKTIPADPSVKNYSFCVVDDTVYYRENSVMKPVEMKDAMLERIKGMAGIRDCTQELIDVQLQEYPDTVIREKQAKLNRLYDAFAKKYGLINSQTNKRAFNQDSSYCLLCSLEKLDDEGNFIGKADMFTKRTIKKAEVVTSVDTATEALAVSLSEKAKVDLDYMADLSGKSIDKIKEELAGVIFQNPVTDKWETADEYLSGNVRDKLETAKTYAENHPEYTVNVQALTQVQPKELDASEIEVRIGATWVKPEYLEDFMRDTFETPQHLFDRKVMGIQFSDVTGQWNVKGKNADYGNSLVNMTYGTSRRNAYQILEDSLNLKDSRVYDTVMEDGKEKRVLNKKETTLAAQKQETIREAFKDWVFRDPDRRQDLVAKYNKLFNSTRPREYDGAHLTFPGMTPDIELKPHQKNAVAHVLYGDNTLLAHCVGAGKTFEMTAAAMESKRLGLCQKSLFVVPNHLTEQWASDFLRLYPGANILAATKKDFEPANRKKFCSRIATGDYDAIIIGHSQFEKIPMSIERQEAMIERQIDEIELAIEQAKADNGERYTIKQMEKSKKSLSARLDKLNDTSRKDNVVTFEQLGVDRLFVDESHNYKNRAKRCRTREV